MIFFFSTSDWFLCWFYFKAVEAGRSVSCQWRSACCRSARATSRRNTNVSYVHSYTHTHTHTHASHFIRARADKEPTPTVCQLTAQNGFPCCWGNWMSDLLRFTSLSLHVYLEDESVWMYLFIFFSFIALLSPCPNCPPVSLRHCLLRLPSLLCLPFAHAISVKCSLPELRHSLGTFYEAAKGDHPRLIAFFPLSPHSHWLRNCSHTRAHTHSRLCQTISASTLVLIGLMS